MPCSLSKILHAGKNHLCALSFQFTAPIVTVLIITALIGSHSFAAEDTNILPAPKKISNHVYAWIGPLPGPSKENKGYRMNLVFVVGANAVAVLDTGYTEAMAREMLAHIGKITDTPVKYAVNTNSQPHRFMGNPVFRRAGAEIIAHRDSAARMAGSGGNFAGAIERILELEEGSVKIPQPPDRIISDKTQLDLGGVSINLKNIGPAHTPAQLIAHIPEDNIVYAGDSLYGERLLTVQPVSNIQSWLDAFEKLKAYGNATFIPGHGHPGPLKDFDFSTRQYLELLFTHMNKMVDEGVDVQDAIDRLDQSRFSKLANFKELAGRNASWAYLEREAAAFE
ncbi:MAG TPA: MBL fold metallo-hydrolase [Gammaproteobacteria bacterium]|nr:MBL fold metallo-hydrolase [Gammaproteobacteria bacterium]